jgi:hypothetical protein
VFDWDTKLDVDVFEQFYLSLNASSLEVSDSKLDPGVVASNDDVAIASHSTMEPKILDEVSVVSTQLDVDEHVGRNNSSFSSNLVENENTTTCDRIKRIRHPIGASLYQNCFAIFPNAFSRVTKRKNHNQYPYISWFFQPVDNKSDIGLEDLDFISLENLGSPFLDLESLKTTTGTNTWLRRLDKTVSKHSVPIYTFLLVRLEHEAFRSYIRTKSILQTMDSGELQNVDSKNDEPIDSQLVRDMVRRYHELTKVAMDSTSDKVVELFLSSLGVSATQARICSLADIICTPLSFVLNSVDPVNGFKYHMINESVEKSLNFLRQEGIECPTQPSVNCQIERFDEADVTDSGAVYVDGGEGLKLEVIEDEIIIQLVDEMQNPSQSRTPKKKKKKCKKKKVRLVLFNCICCIVLLNYVCRHAES